MKLTQKNYLKFSGLIFAVVALMHLLRIFGILEVNANIGGWEVPVWASYIGVLVAGYLAYSANKLGK